MLLLISLLRHVQRLSCANDDADRRDKQVFRKMIGTEIFTRN